MLILKDISSNLTTPSSWKWHINWFEASKHAALILQTKTPLAVSGLVEFAAQFICASAPKVKPDLKAHETESGKIVSPKYAVAPSERPI